MITPMANKSIIAEKTVTAYAVILTEITVSFNQVQLFDPF